MLDNRINKVMILDNGKKYYVLNQAIYKKNSYLLVVGVTDDETDIRDEMKIFKEEKVNNIINVNEVKEQDLLDILVKYLEPRLENN